MKAAHACWLPRHNCGYMNAGCGIAILFSGGPLRLSHHKPFEYGLTKQDDGILQPREG